MCIRDRTSSLPHRPAPPRSAWFFHGLPKRPPPRPTRCLVPTCPRTLFRPPRLLSNSCADRRAHASGPCLMSPPP
eukprot:5716923-Alexandrium_andersonii.AAC.1